MKKLFLTALLIAGLYAGQHALADPFVFQPVVGGSGGIGTVTSVAPGEGNSTSAGTCGSGAITTTGTLTHCQTIRSVTAATDTMTSADCGKKVVGNRATAIAITLPSAAGITGCTIDITSIGVGNVTFTGSIDGVASRVIQRYAGVKITSDGSTWQSSGFHPSVATDGLVDPDQLPIATTSATGAVRADTLCMEMKGTGNKVIGITAACRTVAIAFIIDGGGSAITTGIKGDLEIPFACTITAVRVLLDQSGSIVVDIWKDTYANYPPTDADSITASAPPTVSSATKSEDTTLTGWTTSITAGNILRYNVDSITTATRALVNLTCVKT